VCVGVCACACVSVCVCVRVCIDVFLYTCGYENERVRECVSMSVCVREIMSGARGREGERSRRKRDRVE